MKNKSIFTFTVLLYQQRLLSDDVNTRGMAGANKHILMAALPYNLKKYLKFSRKVPQCILIALQKPSERFLPALFPIFSVQSR